MKLWKRKLKEFDENFEQSEEFKQGKEIGTKMGKSPERKSREN